MVGVRHAIGNAIVMVVELGDVIVWLVTDDVGGGNRLSTGFKQDKDEMLI